MPPGPHSPLAYPARLYAALHRGNPGDVLMYQRVCEGSRRVLELGCGDGRVLLELAAPGRELVGLDLHAGLLEMARAKQVGAAWVQGDMLDPPALLERGSFDRVIVPHGGLYCLLNDGELETALRHAYELVAPGGEFVFDVWAADDFHAEHEPGEQPDAWQDHLGRFEIAGETWEIIERSEWRPEVQRIDVVYTHVRVGETDAVEGFLPQRYFLRDEIIDKLRNAGFDAVHLSGDFQGGGYAPDSDVLVVRATRTP